MSCNSKNYRFGTIPAITLWQPWASLVSVGAKRFEFRSWPAPARLVGLRVGVHAGARAMKRGELVDLLAKLKGPQWRETGLLRDDAVAFIEAVFDGSATIPLSSMMCTATLGRPIRGKQLGLILGVELINDSDRDEHSNWGWPLSDIKPLRPPLPARGAQGWWNWAWTG